MARVRTLLQDGVTGADAKAQGTGRNLLKLEPALGTFVWERAACNGSTPAGGSPVTVFPQEGCVVIPDPGCFQG